MDLKKTSIIKETAVFLVFIGICFLVGFAGVHFYNEQMSDETAYVMNDYSTDFTDQKVHVIVLGADWCEACKATKKLLKKHKVNYIFIDVEKESHPLAKHVENSYPVILMRNIKINGYREELILRHLKLGS
jgi:glutaredoxin